MMAKSSAPVVAEAAAETAAEAPTEAAAKSSAKPAAETAAKADTKTGRINLVLTGLLYSRVRSGNELILIPWRHFTRLELVHA